MLISNRHLVACWRKRLASDLARGVSMRYPDFRYSTLVLTISELIGNVTG